jgi:riboflavin synthase
VEEVGRVDSIDQCAAGARLTVSAEIVVNDLKSADSIAVNGVCLTAVDVKQGSFSADVSPETLERTTLGELSPGALVNLERAATPTTRLGGHLVQGHVDGRGTLRSTEQHGDFWTLKIGYPKELAKYCVEKGSVAVDGISLTIAGLVDDHFDIAVIPKTWKMTNLSSLKPGDAVNIEVDVIAKYVEKLLK